MIYLIGILIALAVGCLFGIQPSVNANLGIAVQHPLQAALISFGTGTLIIAFCCMATGNFPPHFTTTPSQIPIWMWMGGTIGAVVVTSSLIIVPRMGSLPWFAAMITGQVIAATVLDHFGWLGNPRVTASPMRLIGAGLLLAGLLVIVGAKWSDAGSQEEPQSGFAAKNSPRID